MSEPDSAHNLEHDKEKAIYAPTSTIVGDRVHDVTCREARPRARDTRPYLGFGTALPPRAAIDPAGKILWPAHLGRRHSVTGRVSPAGPPGGKPLARRKTAVPAPPPPLGCPHGRHAGDRGRRMLVSWPRGVVLDRFNGIHDFGGGKYLARSVPAYRSRRHAVLPAAGHFPATTPGPPGRPAPGPSCARASLGTARRVPTWPPHGLRMGLRMDAGPPPRRASSARWASRAAEAHGVTERRSALGWRS